MSIQESLFQHLSTDTNITALVEDRIYPLVAPQNVVKPYITFQRISKIPTTEIKDGKSTLDIGRFQINIWSDGYLDGVNIAKTLEQSLTGLAQLDNQLEGFDANAKLYQQILDFLIFENIIGG